MTNPVGTGSARRPRTFGPATLRQWGEWAAIASVLTAAAALAWYGRELSALPRLVAWSLLVMVLAYLLRSGWVRLFGPVLFYDLVRNARRARTYVFRCAYLALLLFFLWSIVGSQLERHQYYRGAPDPKQMAALAESFFATYMGVQFGLALFLTPAYVAGAISEEKERKTLEFLLATDLDSREIVLGKLVARLGYLTLLLLTGLPVLSAVQFLGGVEPLLVFAGFAATAVTVAGLAGVSILASVTARRSRDAIMRTYLAIGVYVAMCVLGSALVDIRYFASAALFTGGPSVADLVEAFQAGNPVYALARVFSSTAGPPQLAVATVLRDYAIFHILLAAATVTLAVVRLRPVALRETAVTRVSLTRRRKERAVSDQPMVWKEMHFDGAMRFRRWSLLLLGLVVALSFAPVPFVLWSHVSSFGYSLSSSANEYVRIVGTLVACVCSLGVAVRAAVAVRIERDKDTLDALLTSPLSAREILFGKWVGCLWSLRWPSAWLGSIYLVGLVTGGLSPLAIPLLAGAILVYSATLAMVGLWFSVFCSTTARATVATVFATLGLSVGHWLIWLCCLPFGGPGGRELEAIVKFQAGLTPPVVLGGVLSFPIYEPGNSSFGQDELFGYCLIGTICWAVLGALIWSITNERFQIVTNRFETIRRDEFSHPGSGQRRPAPMIDSNGLPIRSAANGGQTRDYSEDPVA
jgi:ABC-type transport system involved in multi-copper enzyme maturation permease subunit